MSTVDEPKVIMIMRYVVQAKLLGQDKGTHHQQKRGKEKEYAIQVILSDESQYTIFRTLKDIAVLQSQIMSRFPIEAGYFKKSERVIPKCPVKQTIFGIQRTFSDDHSFEKLLNSYIKGIPGLPASIVKCDLVSNFFSLKASDIQEPGSSKSKEKHESSKEKEANKVITKSESVISGPFSSMSLRSYYAVASYSDKKSKFSFPKGAVVQVMKKDPGGWWMVDNEDSIGWAPASYLVPVDPEDRHTEALENEQLIGSEKVGARYISVSNYQASRDDELSFVHGAVVKVLKKQVDGWWLVRYNGGEGYVPGALLNRLDKRQATFYVKKIKRNFINRKSTRVIPTIRPKWMDLNERGTRRGGPVKTADTPTLALYLCKANFEGSAERCELTLSKNDTVKVLDKKVHGWWYAEDMHGQSGWVPATYLRPILDNGTRCLAGCKKIIGSIQKILQSHRAEQEDELSVRRGESVEVVMVSLDGWWIVRNTETGEQGLIPSLCITQEPQGDVDDNTEAVPEQLESRSEPLLGVSDDRSVVSDLSSHSTSVLSKWAGSALLEDLDEAGGEKDLDGCYIAARSYTKQAMDEIDLREGQIVCVIDDSESDEWYVNCDGKEGWVPANILKEYIEDEFPMSGENTPNSSRLISNPVSCKDSDDSQKRIACSSSLGFSHTSNGAIKGNISHDSEAHRRISTKSSASRRISTESSSSISTSRRISITSTSRRISTESSSVTSVSRRISITSTSRRISTESSGVTSASRRISITSTSRRISTESSSSISTSRRISITSTSRRISTESSGVTSASRRISITSTSTTVMVVDEKILDKLEREMLEAEKKVEDARRLAMQLKQKFQYAQRLSSKTLLQ